MSSLKRKTPLRRRTPLKAKTWLRPKPKETVELGADGFREHAYHRSGGLCECGCGIPLDMTQAVSHHVFFKSRISKAIKDEWWNGALIRRECHLSIHDLGDQERRRRTEEAAIDRLRAFIGWSWNLLVTNYLPEGATAPSAYVRAYELMRRNALQAA